MSTSAALSGHTYKQSGVDIHEAASLVDDIGVLVKRTQQKRKLANPFGLFAAAYDLGGYKHPVIVTGCDGVGTKIELLIQHDFLEVAGKDLVAMNVNDVLTTGASANACALTLKRAGASFVAILALARADRRIGSGPEAAIALSQFV